MLFKTETLRLGYKEIKLEKIANKGVWNRDKKLQVSLEDLVENYSLKLR